MSFCMSRQPGGGRETAWWQKPEKEGHSGRVDLVPSPPLLRVSRGRNLNPLKINEIAKCQIIFKEQQKEREVGRVFEEEGDNQHATRDRKTSKTSYGMYRQHQIKDICFQQLADITILLAISKPTNNCCLVVNTQLHLNLDHISLIT